MTQDYNSYTYITTWSAAGVATQVSTDPCVLKAIIVNITTRVLVGVIDGTSGTAVNIAQLGTATTAGSYLYNLQTKSGLRIVMKAHANNIRPNITVVWRR